MDQTYTTSAFYRRQLINHPMNNHFILTIAVFIVAVLSAPLAFESVNAQTVNNSTEQGVIALNETFASALDLFAVPESIGGYGVYEERNTNAFSPGEDIVLYVEPTGFSHQPVAPIAPNNDTLYLMNFTADIVITDTDGNVLAGFQDLPISEIVSHHQNKEINLVITLSQSSPFPEGNYTLLYTVRDEPSGNTFEVAKDITIADSGGDDLVG
jgi:hypothetical protein